MLIQILAGVGLGLVGVGAAYAIYSLTKNLTHSPDTLVETLKGMSKTPSSSGVQVNLEEPTKPRPPLESQILRILVKKGPLSAYALGQELGLTRGRTFRMLTKMEQEGMVESKHISNGTRKIVWRALYGF